MESIFIFIIIGIVIILSARSVYRTFKGDKAHCSCENSDCAKFGDCSSIHFSEDCDDEKKPGMMSIPMKVKPSDN